MDKHSLSPGEVRILPLVHVDVRAIGVGSSHVASVVFDVKLQCPHCLMERTETGFPADLYHVTRVVGDFARYHDAVMEVRLPALPR